MICLTLTYPPSANRLWRNVGGKTIKSADYRSWIKANEHLAYGLKTIAGPYILTLAVTPPDKRRRDLANLEKASSDLLQAIGAITDDANLEALHMHWDRKGPARVVAIVTPYQREAA